MHGAFALAALALGAGAALELSGLRALRAEARAVSVAAAGGEAPSAPRARLARALALGAAGEVEPAEAILAELADGPGAVAADARFALANLYLREGAREGVDPARARAWLELAKARYRDALARAPGDVDARLNLERALRLAPEGEGAGPGTDLDPVKSVDVVFPDFAPTDLP